MTVYKTDLLSFHNRAMRGPNYVEVVEDDEDDDLDYIPTNIFSPFEFSFSGINEQQPEKQRVVEQVLPF